MREIIDRIDDLRFRSKAKKHELSHLANPDQPLPTVLWQRFAGPARAVSVLDAEPAVYAAGYVRLAGPLGSPKRCSTSSLTDCSWVKLVRGTILVFCLRPLTPTALARTFLATLSFAVSGNSHP
jgi:hypothetical protein